MSLSESGPESKANFLAWLDEYSENENENDDENEKGEEFKKSSAAVPPILPFWIASWGLESKNGPYPSKTPMMTGRKISLTAFLDSSDN